MIPSYTGWLVWMLICFSPLICHVNIRCGVTKAYNLFSKKKKTNRYHSHLILADVSTVFTFRHEWSCNYISTEQCSTWDKLVCSNLVTLISNRWRNLDNMFYKANVCNYSILRVLRNNLAEPQKHFSYIMGQMYKLAKTEFSINSDKRNRYSCRIC